MSRIEIPKPVEQKSSAPSWVNKEALLQASGKEAKKNQETLSKIKSEAQIVVLSYFNPNNNAVFSADDTRLLAQMRLQKNQGSAVFKYTDPDTDEPLFAYKTAKRVKKVDNVRYSNTELKPERGGTYTNTFIDRHIAYKALEEMQRYATSKGMAIPRARYIRSSYGSKQMGSNLVTINNILTELEWHYGRNQKGRVFATISIDPAGKFIQPLTFKIASGEDFEFTEENIRMLEKDARFMEMVTLIKPKKTDIPTFRRPDISRFMATASLKKDAMDPAAPINPPATGTGQPTTNPAAAIAPTAPGNYQPGAQYTNPADGKIYTIKSYDPNSGAVVTSPEGQDMSVPANEVTNLQPVMPTAGKKTAYEFSVEAMAEEMVQKHLRNDMKEDTQQAKELHGLAVEEEGEVSDDQELINMISTKKEAGEKGNCSKCGKPNFICRGKCSGDDSDNKDDNKDDDTKEASLPSLKTVTAKVNKNVHFSHVPGMSKRWSEIRKGLQEKLNKEKGDRPFDLAPEKMSREQQESARLVSVGYKGYSPLNNDANDQGRDAKTHIPTRTSGDVEIGMTEYEDYNKPLQEVQQEMVDRREHFQNQDKLPLANMRRDEIKDYVKGDDKKNYGLSETSRDGEFENPELQFEASDDALANEMIQKKSMEGGVEIGGLQDAFGRDLSLGDRVRNEEGRRGEIVSVEGISGNVDVAWDDVTSDVPGSHYVTKSVTVPASDLTKWTSISKKAMGEESEGAPVQERPIVHKDIKKAPGLEGYKEPETIMEAESKVKEGITKLRKVQEDIKEVKEKLQGVIAPLQKQLQEAQKPFNEDLIKKQESLSSYLEMIYSQLSQTDDKIAAYEDKIFAVVERSKDETTKVSLPKLLKQLETTDKVLFDSVIKVKEAMENEVVVSVLERFLYEYPVSKQHELKKVVRKSMDEEGAFNAAIKILKDALMGLFNLSDTLGENLEVA